MVGNLEGSYAYSIFLSNVCQRFSRLHDMVYRPSHHRDGTSLGWDYQPLSGEEQVLIGDMICLYQRRYGYVVREGNGIEGVSWLYDIAYVSHGDFQVLSDVDGIRSESVHTHDLGDGGSVPDGYRE